RVKAKTLKEDKNAKNQESLSQSLSFVFVFSSFLFLFSVAPCLRVEAFDFRPQEQGQSDKWITY
ncbi:MAG: hypothetical protein MJK04_08805, partial [Psychrosphaera sp.]|nr:hypothetical protein [Psychrosphaera sp.]